MNRKMRYLIIAVFIASSVWFYFTPHMAVSKIESAIEAKDTARLSEYISYPELKESLKAEFNTTLSTTAGQKINTDPFNALGAALVAGFVDPMIDTLVTPEGLAMMMKGNVSRNNKHTSASSNPSDTDIQISTFYEDFNHFIVVASPLDAPNEPVKLVFNRHGLFSWKLSSVRLP
ncbi:MAG: DUF2939 domain-containing protein [Nitrosomonas sp.]|nr:DUF2939 domain-containing protein [Nitrosomonas sp.]